MSNKRKTLITILISVLIIAIVLVVIFVCQKKKPKSYEEETTNWNTYKNDQCGFEIKYPEAWENPSILTDSPECARYFTCFHPENLVIGVNDWIDPWDGIVCINEAPAHWEYIDSGEEIVIDSIKVSPIIYSRLEDKLHIIYVKFCVDKNNRYSTSCHPKNTDKTFYYQIFFRCPGRGETESKDKKECVQLFNQIIITFRFIEE